MTIIVIILDFIKANLNILKYLLLCNTISLVKNIKKLTFTLAITFVLAISLLIVPSKANALDCSKELSPAGQALFCGGSNKLATNSDTTNVIINNIANWLMGILGVVLAIVILISAIQIVTSGGSPDAVKSAKGRLAQAAISLGLLISFRAILALIGI